MVCSITSKKLTADTRQIQMCKSTCVANEDKKSFAIWHLQLENFISEVENFLTLADYITRLSFDWLPWI